MITENGFLAAIVPMPINLVVIGVGKPKDCQSAFPNNQNRVIAGQTVGGSMAVNFTDNHPGSLDGIIWWASYPANSDDLSSFSKIQASEPLLPRDTRFAAIEEGNHGQFRWYGPLSGDHEATISRKEQKEIIAQATLDFLATVGSKK